jgi:hypothetical protein
MSRLWIRGFVGMLFIALAGCSIGPKPGDLARIDPGASKSQVLTILGTPTTAVSKDRIETLFYDLPTTPGSTERFFVRIVNGSVDSYGKADESTNLAVPCGK